MVPYYSELDLVVRDFESLGIPVSSPGFYDHPRFIEAEQADWRALRNYGRFVHERQYDRPYLAHAAKIIRVVADGLYKRLVEDGRLGACVDICLVASRILEAEGIWNCMMAGPLTIAYPSRFGNARRHFWWYDTQKVAAAHAWLFAPPYRVVDITIRQQHHDSGLQAPLPKVVLAKQLKKATIENNDLVSPEARINVAAEGLTVDEFIRREKPDLSEFIRVFPPGIVNRGGILLKYIPWQVTVPDAPLEKITSLQLNGKHGIQIYENDIAPRLSNLRP